jgi:repressor LexA
MEVEGLKPGCEPPSSTGPVDNPSSSMLVIQPTRELTARQSAIVAFIRTHVTEHGYPPTVRDIAAAVGLVSPSSVAYQLGELARRGAVA